MHNWKETQEQEKIIWELFTQEASEKCGLQHHAMGWVLLRDCTFILGKNNNFFAGYII